jgi:hypothetical protein
MLFPLRPLVFRVRDLFFLSLAFICETSDGHFHRAEADFGKSQNVLVCELNGLER